MAKRKKKNRNLYLGHYIVAFVDLLGQQDFLRNLSLPTSGTPEEIEATKQQLINTYGAVKRMRKLFDDSFLAFARRNTPPDWLTDEQRKEFKALTNNPIKYQGFSDSVVVFMPLRTDTAKLPIRGVYGVLGAAATTFTCSLAAGHPIRGGIDVGLGMNITAKEVYGPSLSRAYTLESDFAEYPRIIVSNELINYLEAMRDQPIINMSTEVTKQVAIKCLECIALDDDGRPFVDHLGEHYRQTFGEVVDATVIQQAYNQVLSFYERYQEEGNEKLTSRYYRLKKYFESRLPLWEDLFSHE